MFTKSGPWGGEGGSAWDDEHVGGIRQIAIHHGKAIHSIQIGYDVKRTLVWGDSHGGRGGSRTVISLKYPKEFLVGVSGSWGNFENNVVIRSLKFQSNKRTYGPYGVEQGTPFSYSAAGGKIVGFYGRSGGLLDAIGVHCKPPGRKSCLELFLPTSFCDTFVCCQCNWSLFRGC